MSICLTKLPIGLAYSVQLNTTGESSLAVWDYFQNHKNTEVSIITENFLDIVSSYHLCAELAVPCRYKAYAFCRGGENIVLRESVK